MKRTCAAVVLAHLVLGCAPSVLWQARSDDRRYAVRLESVDGGERVVAGEVSQAAFEHVLVTHLVLGAGGPSYVGERGGLQYVVAPQGTFGPFDEVGELLVRGETVAFTVRRGDRWSVERATEGRSMRVGTELDGVRPGTLRLDADDQLAFVGRLGDAERLIWDVHGSSAISPPVDVVRAVFGYDGGYLAVLREDGAERLVRGTSSLEIASSGWEEVLELNVARDGSFAFFGARADDVVLMHGTSDGVRAWMQAPVLTHLRLSEDGAHVACLVPAPSGDGIALARDGETVSSHRRIEGERVAFVPGTSALVWVAEDRQAPRVLVEGLESARYAVIEGPVLSEGRVGFVGRERVGESIGSGSEVVIFDVARASMEVVARETWAGQLRLGRVGHAFAARRGGERFVVTSRGSWPVPRFFVDTLVLDDAGEHWSAIVPDRGERALSVWIDGEPSAILDLDEVASRVVRGHLDAPSVMIEIARAELAARGFDVIAR